MQIDLPWEREESSEAAQPAVLKSASVYDPQKFRRVLSQVEKMIKPANIPAGATR